MKKLFTTLLFSSLVLFANAQSLTHHIKVDQFGYLPESIKVAIIADPQQGYDSSESYLPGSTMELRNSSNDATVFTGDVISWNNGNTNSQSGDVVWWFDFTAFEDEGEYYIYDPQNDTKSFTFSIDDNVYYDVLKQAVRTFFYQRCGIIKSAELAGTWADGASHIGIGQDTECRLITEPNNAETERDLSGGWYDAGDYNKYVNFTYSSIHDLLFAYQENTELWTDDFDIPESENGIPDLLDEIKWELDWLLKMQLPDGSVLMKVSVNQFQAESPPSADDAPRYYGSAQASATRSLASMMAHAYLVYSTIDDPVWQAYANSLLSSAELAWTWTQNNPNTSSYSNTGFSSANPEESYDAQMETLTGAAAMLYAATGENSYREYFDQNYINIRPYSWGYWYAFQPTIQDIMLYYSNLENATPSVATNIQNSCINSMTAGNPDMLPAYWDETGAYRSYLSDQDYTWGSNRTKSNVGNMHWNMLHYGLDSDNTADYRNSADGFLHYLHGVNPLAMVMLSNMNAYEAENSVDEIYHGWFFDGTNYDNAQTSLYGPAPGYLAGGCNPHYNPDGAYTGPAIEPPDNQPILKSFWDWNTSWPENSWEITEPSISYQAAYVRFLSKYVLPDEGVSTRTETVSISDIGVSLFPNPVREILSLNFDNPNPEQTVMIYDNLGKKVFEKIYSHQSRVKISTSQWTTGLYYLSINGATRNISFTIVD